ncbi:hypothetical protein EYF80_012002 [Liparis tanakae]|uniref:Uncharacterized protein n=1 Tax=Liparis tanakae TaxID=230148 RepID=A0A4Z2IJR0_9TELE|nr:hypothetical protein EYF80_012002 [Liparis tanakae]
MKNSMVRLEMMKKKISALTWCVGIRALSHCMPARDAQSIRCSLISSKANRGNFSNWRNTRKTIGSTRCGRRLLSHGSSSSDWEFSRGNPSGGCIKLRSAHL